MTKYLKFKTPAQDHAGDLKSEYGLKNHGLVHLDRVYWNLPESALIEEAVFRGEGKIVNGGAFLVETGKWTARAANEKYIVREPSTEDKIDWGHQNRPMSLEKFNNMQARLQSYLQGEELFVQDCYVGADPEYRMPVRIITDLAFQSLFARNMMIKVDTLDEHKKFVPDFTLIASPSFKVDPRVDGTGSETARPSPPIPSVASSATTSTAGATTGSSTTRAAATPRSSASRPRPSRRSTSARTSSARSSRT